MGVNRLKLSHSIDLPLTVARLWAVVLLALFCHADVAADPPTLAPPTAKSDTESAPSEADGTRQDRPGAEWVRVLKDDQGRPLAMQTAIVRYQGTPAGGQAPVTVDLVGAVHVGDRDYYHELNRRFTEYDVLLYELVAPDGTVVQKGTGTSSRHPLGALQNGMKEMLELEHQLEQVDYTRPNFLHADMSPDEFFKSMEKKNEGFVQMYFRLLGQSLAHQSRMNAQGESADFDFFRAILANDRARQLKIAMAKQLSQMESMLTAFGGEEGSTIITERNKKALKVLREQLEAGKARVAIFYGAGHLSDMGGRLQNEFNLRPTQVTWLTAWDLKGTDPE